MHFKILHRDNLCISHHFNALSIFPSLSIVLPNYNEYGKHAMNIVARRDN